MAQRERDDLRSNSSTTRRGFLLGAGTLATATAWVGMPRDAAPFERSLDSRGRDAGAAVGEDDRVQRLQTALRRHGSELGGRRR